MNKFRELGIKDELLEQLQLQRITEPTPIQEQVIPHILNDKDIIAEAQTGTGKTLAFLLPMFEKMSSEIDRVQGLIVTPTRELAIQITDEAKKINGNKGINILAAYGGQDLAKQLHKLKNNVHLIIATPGRLIDHIQRETIDLSSLDMLVLDEADQMLHIGFKNEVEFIIRKTPRTRQTMCFSATMNKAVNKLAYKNMKDPVTVSVKKKEITLENIEQHVVHTTDRNKINSLCSVMDRESPFMAIIFCRTKRRVDALEEKLHQAGYNCKKLHGDMTQSKREQVMKDFKATKIQYLIATEVASRGLDIYGVSHVFNYDIPETGESYIHRIGRTGRAGEKGKTFLFVAPRDETLLHAIEKTIKMNLPRKEVEITRKIETHNYGEENKASSKDNKKHFNPKHKKKPSSRRQNSRNKKRT